MPNGQLIQQNIETPNTMAGVANAQYLLLDAIGAEDVGWWIQWNPYRNGSFEITSPTSLTGTIVLKCSNAALMPGNGFLVTVTDSGITAGDVLTISIQSSAFMNGYISASYTVKVSDNTDTKIATGLAAALVAALNSAQYMEILSQGVNIAAGSIQVTHADAVVTILTQIPFFPQFTVTTSTSAGATETLTVTQYDSGLGFTVPNCSVTAVGNVVFNQPAT